MTEFNEIPVIELGSRTDADLAADLRRAYGQTGFGYISQHGIPQALTDAVFDAARQFHALPLAQKMAISVNKAHRGYIPINTSTDVNSTLADVTKPNQSASFMMMREDEITDPDIYLSGPNQWPDLPGFRETLMAYNEALSRLGRRLMRVALLAAGVEDMDFLDSFDMATTWLRLLHYPPQPTASPEDLYGSAPHKDFGCLTLLSQGDIGGLQVQTPAGNWVDAPYIPGTLVVNVGDMLHRLSNGRLLSTPHRVINRSGKERYSIPFFFDPHVNTEIAPLPGTGNAKFATIRFADFLRNELEAAYDVHQQSPREENST
ncbi:oxidoreductase, 2OG-Fe(II) oxygenase family protein [Roseobacter sp. SK209-2-6]|uniref:isopenicillin N synthase family dioxygenase n=1 Tax=Roseobacter sp. SK209-2-6 TaxID=388739 RepID=UPI0000F3CFC9|nr:2OG-Fe(II) oxygenase family protein [Roseobacter sp. SK209-2-6]EBA15283.1 oxidoreductase, 2OG-Fe(II) oxygenase family protein [Roseobacter sp. SK209-2-6]